ncbi:MAG: hypothetical protein CO093_00785 [Alphaproteobacteria bacterium CG_4_9_14_3_um_filter_47_13]|nr:MAG: hypothetical protein CO093_00785 [Alphaproteobacteria bacterium CG_4_9_14_3_um_filter_47_13]
MNIKYFQMTAFIGAILLMGLVGKSASQNTDFTQQYADIETSGGSNKKKAPYENPDSIAGKYLSSHFAQNHYDWETANHYINDILVDDPQNSELIRRSMILAMGSGDIKMAAKRASSLIKIETSSDDGLALMILAVNDMAQGNMTAATNHLEKMKAGDMTDFVKPVLKGWAEAASGRFDVTGFNDTIIHNYHAALLATFLDKHAEIKKYTDAMIAAGTLSNADAERTADMLAVLGHFKEAEILYQGIYTQDNSNRILAEKIAELKKENGGIIQTLIEPLKIKEARQGAALAMYDMAYILYHEQSDSSTKIFAHMALALDPDMTNAQLLLADTLMRNGRLKEAVARLNTIPSDHPSYLAVQRYAAELLADMGQEDEALQKLNRLFTDYNDVESLIRIGDLYRSKENFKDALSAYNRAANQIGTKIPEQYWYLLYARGMTYEREGDWNKAESDLKTALLYRPDHPYLLNYLGYGWADKGLHLEQSLELIKRAIEIQPTDGYIIDSLGWVQYMMALYDEALPNLEHAVELLPYDSTINDHLGDAYWRVGRHTEARYQWERALNYSKENEETLQKKLRHKLHYGLEGMDEVKHAESVQ